MSGPMLWIQNCLNRTAGDREDDGKFKLSKKSVQTFCIKFLYSIAIGFCSQGSYSMHETHIGISAVWSIETVVVPSPGMSQDVPLVPLTEANEEAMDNKRFQRLLRKLGMRAPANEQVCFLWYLTTKSVISPHSNYSPLICSLCFHLKLCWSLSLTEK